MSLRKQATSGLVWVFTQQFGNQFVSFFVSLVLARILLPEEFGLIGMIAIFYSIGRSLMDSGMTQSLIRSTNLDQEDFSTAFYFNLASSITLYTLIFLAAPYIAEFYSRPILTPIIKLYCITFIIDAFTAVQRTRMTREMDFKTQTLIAIPSTILGGVVGVTLAYMGYGVWSLVWSTIATSFFGSLQFWIYSKWTPSLVFNIDKFKQHFGFGIKLSASGLLNKIFNNIYLIVIGRYFSAAQVGFYTRADTMKQLPVNNITNALAKVTYPLFAKIQDDNFRLKRVYKQLMQMVIFVISPVLIIVAVLAEPVFRFLFTEKWLPAVPYFQILCVIGILYPLNMYNINILKVKGKSGLILKLQVIKKILTIIMIAGTIQFGIYGLLYGQVLLSIISFFINAFYTGKFIQYGTWQQIKDIVPTILLAVLCGIFTWVADINFNSQRDIIRIGLGIVVGFGFYLGLSFLIQMQSLIDLKKLILKR